MKYMRMRDRIQVEAFFIISGGKLPADQVQLLTHAEPEPHPASPVPFPLAAAAANTGLPEIFVQ